MPQDYDYGQLLDDFELGADVMPGESLTDYIERRRREFESKAEGGSIGIEVLFGPKREEYQTGGRTIDSRATTQDYANALKNVSAGTTYQQQADAKRYARQEAANELRAARQGGDVALDNFLRSAGASNYRSIFTDSRPGTNRQGAFTGTYNARKEQLLDRLMNQKLQATSYAPAPKPRPKTYRTVSPEAQALNMSQSTYEDIIRSGKDPKQYYMDYQNRLMTAGGNYGTPGTSSYTGPQLLKYGQVIGGPGMMSGIAGPGMGPGATPPTQAQINQMMQNNPMGYADFDALVKQYSSADPYKGLKEEIKDMVGGRDTGYMSAQDYYDINVLGLDGKGIAEKYGLQYADGGRVGLFMGGPPLEGQALNIYESMNAYGFTDQEIANALSAQGLYTPNKTTTTTTTTPVINKAPNIINQGGGDGGGGGAPKGGLGLSRFDYGYTSPGGVFNIDDIGEGTVADEDYTLGMRLGDLGTGIKGGLAKAYQDLRSLPTPFNIASKGLGNIKDFFEKKAAEKAEAEAAAAQTAFDQIMSSAKSQQDFYDSLNDGRGATSTAESRSTAGDAPGYSGPSPFAKGGLATMFKPRRR